MTTGTIPEFGHAEADLLVFHEIARALTSSLDLESILTAVLRQIQRCFQPETWALLLTDERQRDLHYTIADGRFGHQMSGVRVPWGVGLAGSVAERGEALIITEGFRARSATIRLDDHLDFEIQSVVCIPLRSRLRTLGVIQLFNVPSGTISDYTLSFLLVLCDFAAIAVENANAFQRVQELTIIDECTGLFNVRHFDQSLQNEISRSQRLNLSMSLLFLDLDHFKRVNDQYGHQAGSRLLSRIGAIIREHIRNFDLAFRYGGDEFVILLPGTDKANAIQVAKRLLFALREEQHAVSEKLSIRVTASFGVASYPEDGGTAAEILRTADARMYEVKGTTRDDIAHSGRGRSLEESA